MSEAVVDKAGARDTARSASVDERSAEDGVAFEHLMQRLEQVVVRLEGGDLDLEASLASFEEGVRLSRACGRRLDEAERRIEVLLADAEDGATRPLTATDPTKGLSSDV